jgi:hypothetical protein
LIRNQLNAIALVVNNFVALFFDQSCLQQLKQNDQNGSGLQHLFVRSAKIFYRFRY